MSNNFILIMMLSIHLEDTEIGAFWLYYAAR